MKEKLRKIFSAFPYILHSIIISLLFYDAVYAQQNTGKGVAVPMLDSLWETLKTLSNGSAGNILCLVIIIAGGMQTIRAKTIEGIVWGAIGAAALKGLILLVT